MKNYKIIGEFYYKEKQYQLLLDSDKKYFFLRINEKRQYEYITFKELIELTRKFSYNPNIQYTTNLGEKKENGSKIKIIPKVLLNGTIMTIITLSLLKLTDNGKSPKDYTNYTTTITVAEEQESDTTQKAINDLLDKVAKEKENFEIQTSSEGFNLTIVYDAVDLEKTLGYKKEEITYKKIRETIKNNNNISDKYKEICLTLANNLEKKYPTMDLRIWYENLKTLKIVECDEMEMKLKAVSATAYACYRKDENTIYTDKKYDYEPGTWEYQIIIHELCHPIRSAQIKLGNNEIRTQFESQSGSGTIIGEAMNSLLALRSYDETEQDIAYQLQSNMIEVMVDSLDNYTYQDFVEHNITYFENELNKQNGDDKAVYILSLMELQYKDYHDNDILVEQSQYYEIYDYIAKMYYDKNINSNMSYTEASVFQEKLVGKIIYDVPEEYNVDTEHFNDYFNQYCSSIGINNGKTM